MSLYQVGNGYRVLIVLIASGLFCSSVKAEEVADTVSIEFMPVGIWYALSFGLVVIGWLVAKSRQ